MRAFRGELRLPSWVISGSPDAARQILSSLAGSLITVVGVVFSVVIVALDAVIRLHYRPGHLSARTVPEPADQADMAARHEALLALHERAARCLPGGSTA